MISVDRNCGKGLIEDELKSLIEMMYQNIEESFKDRYAQKYFKLMESA